MARKSFDLDDEELRDAKRRASEAGVSLNRYIRLAVVEKNAGQAVLADMHLLRSEMSALLAQMASVSEHERAQRSDDLRQAIELMQQEQADAITRQQDLTKQFVRVLGEQLSSHLASGQPTTIKPAHPWGGS